MKLTEDDISEIYSFCNKFRYSYSKIYKIEKISFITKKRKHAYMHFRKHRDKYELVVGSTLLFDRETQSLDKEFFSITQKQSEEIDSAECFIFLERLYKKGWKLSKPNNSLILDKNGDFCLKEGSLIRIEKFNNFEAFDRAESHFNYDECYVVKEVSLDELVLLSMHGERRKFYLSELITRQVLLCKTNIYDLFCEL